jgi:carboxymethylenebutenolidase
VLLLIALQLVAERIYWDQATVLVQIGVLDAATIPGITGVEQAEKTADMSSHPSNALMGPA